VATTVVAVDLRTATPYWSLPSRVGFRFLFVYVFLYSLLTQLFTSLLPIPNLELPDLSTRWPVRPIVLWTAVHIFRVPRPPYADTGSGDKMFDWTLVFCLLVFAAVATVAWSVFFQVHQGSLYPALHRLEDRGWLQAEWKESETGREAKFYSFTKKGQRQMEAEVANWERLCNAVGLVLRSSEGDF